MSDETNSKLVKIARSDDRGGKYRLNVNNLEQNDVLHLASKGARKPLERMIAVHVHSHLYYFLYTMLMQFMRNLLRKKTQDSND